MTFVTPSFAKPPASSIFGTLAREAAFALKLYPLAGIAAIGISFASALLGYPIATLQAPPSIEEPIPPAPTLSPFPTDTKPPTAPVPDDNAPKRGGTIWVGVPKEKDYAELQSFLLGQVKEAGEAKLVEEPKLGDTVPKSVHLKPLPSDIEPRLKWMGYVDKDARATAIFLFTDEVFIVNPANKVVGVVPLAQQPHQKPQ
jgi:hypothetical protein